MGFGTLVAVALDKMVQRRFERLDQRGSISLEYLIVLVFAGVLVVIAVVPVLGPAIVDEYTVRRSILYSTYP